LGEPVVAVGAVPDQTLDRADQPRRDRLQLQLGTELEEGVRRQAGLLGAVTLARAHGGLHLVEADRDQVEVALRVGLPPLLGQDPVEGVGGACLDRLDPV
jgi:hypothetical protein